MTNKEVLEVFEKTQGILKGHFILTSGRHSDTYMQCAKLFVNPKESSKLCEELAKKLSDIKVDMVASPAVGGIIMGYEMARQLNAKNIFFERQDGQMTLRRGFEIKSGSNIVVVEDVVTTGGSVKEVIKQVELLGGNVVAVASIVDRSNGQVDFGVRYEALLPIEVISYEEKDCPLCKQGMKAIKPGSRTLK